MTLALVPDREGTPIPSSSVEEHILPTLYQQQIHQTKYARWRDDLGRRETWAETVDRYMEFIQYHLSENHRTLDSDTYWELRNAILKHEVLPSMRALMTAGPALERDHAAAYNCAFVALNRIAAFDESLYLLCCGVGVGFSVEREHVNQLPEIPEYLYESESVIVVPDSKIGWATSFRELLFMLYAGKIPKLDFSLIRPAGSRLKTFGGRASGPDPLRSLFLHAIETFKQAVGRKLSRKECHSIMCKIGDIVVVGGVRRSALISLSDLDDEEMRDAKSGAWWEDNPHFALSNNSAVYPGTPDRPRFDAEWDALIKSGSGERGILNKEAIHKKLDSIGRDTNQVFGVNPCGEIILRDRQFCNLTEIVARPKDTHFDLLRKARLATILGTIQSTFTNFRYLSSKWKDNCDEERLLGVSITGVMDHPVLNGSRGEDSLRGLLRSMRKQVHGVNASYAAIFSINPTAAASCNKPSGNASQLVYSASGINERHADFYVRRNRGNKTDPVAQLLYYQGVPCEDEIFHPDTTWVFSYPIKSPPGSITRRDRTAVEKLKHWMIFAEEWCDHNPSVTVNVKSDEWQEVGDFVYPNFDKMLGLTFLPLDDHAYQQAPYEEITEDEYNNLVAQMPQIDWDLLSELEQSDQTQSAKELACSAGGCEI